MVKNTTCASEPLGPCLTAFEPALTCEQAARELVACDVGDVGDVARWAKEFDGLFDRHAISVIRFQAPYSPTSFVAKALRALLGKYSKPGGRFSQAATLLEWTQARAAPRKSAWSHERDAEDKLVWAMAQVGAIPRALGSHGDSILHLYAASGRDFPLMATLKAMGPLAAGAELSRRGKEGRTPAEAALERGAIVCVEAMDEAWGSFPVNAERSLRAKHPRFIPADIFAQRRADVERAIVHAQCGQDAEPTPPGAAPRL